MALRTPALLDLLCLVKKLTVIGIIGNTQGVNKAANPEKNAIMKIDQSPISSSSDAGLETVGIALFDTSFTTAKLVSIVVKAVSEVTSGATKLVVV